MKKQPPRNESFTGDTVENLEKILNEYFTIASERCSYQSAKAKAITVLHNDIDELIQHYWSPRPIAKKVD